MTYEDLVRQLQSLRKCESKRPPLSRQEYYTQGYTPKRIPMPYPESVVTTGDLTFDTPYPVSGYTPAPYFTDGIPVTAHTFNDLTPSDFTITITPSHNILRTPEHQAAHTYDSAAEKQAKLDARNFTRRKALKRIK